MKTEARLPLKEQHGFEVGRTVEIFPPENFRLLKRATFQPGLNHLFVFERAALAGVKSPWPESPPAARPVLPHPV